VGKRIAIISLVLLISGLGILGYFIQQSRKSLFTDPYRTISPDAAVVIETVALQSFVNSIATDKGLMGEVWKVNEFEISNIKLKSLADLLNKAEFKKIFNDGPAVISFYPSPAGKLQALVSLVVPGTVRLRHIKEMLQASGIRNVFEGGPQGNQVIRIPFSAGNTSDTVCLSLASGLILCSCSEELIAKGRLQMNTGNDIRNYPGFRQVLTASGKNEDKIFVLFPNLTKLLDQVIRKEKRYLAEAVTRLAGTAEGDIYINNDGLVLSGYTESTDSSEILYRYKDIPTHEFHTFKILPSSTVIFETLVLQPQKTPERNIAATRADLLEMAGKLQEMSDKEVTRAFIDIREQPVSNNTLIIYELANRVRTEQLFFEEKVPKNNILYFEPDDQTKVPVYRTSSYSGLTRLIMPRLAPDFTESYFAFYDNYMIAGNSFFTISRLLYDNLLNKTLANDVNYRDFEKTLPSRGGYFFYCVPSRIINYFAEFLDENIISSLKSNKSSLNKIQAIGYQFASSNKMLYNSLSISFKEAEREESPTEWETLLDTVAAIKPFFFTNHITGAKEIFIQDMKNNTYLINAAGRVLWKVQINEKITGNIYMIDYFRNGKYQLLFSGKEYLHLLDRNGNYVERYPVKLRSRATNPLALFDYDNNRDYRLFIAGEDKLIYSYDKTGSVVKGWKPFRTAGNVRSEINYFRVSGKDYLVASDEMSVYFLDRTGNKRVNLKDAVTRAEGSAMRLTPVSEPSVVCTAPDGTVQHIFFDGTVRKFSLNKFSRDHSFNIFDVDGDGFDEYVFIDKGIMYLYDHDRSRMFSRDFGSYDLGGPINFIFSGSDRKIGVYDNEKKLIYLIDRYGRTMKGFPLRGASMFSIGRLSDKGGWNLIVGGTGKFLYNYKLETDNN
jgi:hypothetical protein